MCSTSCAEHWCCECAVLVDEVWRRREVKGKGSIFRSQKEVAVLSNCSDDVSCWRSYRLSTAHFLGQYSFMSAALSWPAAAICSASMFGSHLVRVTMSRSTLSRATKLGNPNPCQTWVSQRYNKFSRERFLEAEHAGLLDPSQSSSSLQMGLRGHSSSQAGSVQGIGCRR